MELGYITKDNLSAYRSLLLPEAAQAIERGEPLTALGVAEGDLACGALAGYLDDDCFRIMSLYMAPGYRRRGGGTLMLATLSAVLGDMPGAGAMRADYTATEPEHDSLVAFFKILGFAPVNRQGEDLYLFTLAQAAASPLFGNGELSTNLRTFSQLPGPTLIEADRRARAQDIPMSEALLTSDGIDKDISVALLDGKKVISFLAFDHSFGGKLTLSSAWAAEADPTAMLSMLRGAFKLAMAKLPPETEIAVQAVNDATVRLVHTILPDARAVSRSYYLPAWSH